MLKHCFYDAVLQDIIKAALATDMDSLIKQQQQWPSSVLEQWRS